MWEHEQDKSFNYIKTQFKTDKLLRLFNSNLKTSIETDASAVGIGVVLMQKHADAWYQVRFASWPSTQPNVITLR